MSEELLNYAGCDDMINRICVVYRNKSAERITFAWNRELSAVKR